DVFPSGWDGQGADSRQGLRLAHQPPLGVAVAEPPARPSSAEARTLVAGPGQPGGARLFTRLHDPPSRPLPCPCHANVRTGVRLPGLRRGAGRISAALATFRLSRDKLKTGSPDCDLRGDTHDRTRHRPT